MVLNQEFTSSCPVSLVLWKETRALRVHFFWNPLSNSDVPPPSPIHGKERLEGIKGTFWARFLFHFSGVKSKPP